MDPKSTSYPEYTAIHVPTKEKWDDNLFFFITIINTNLKYLQFDVCLLGIHLLVLIPDFSYFVAEKYDWVVNGEARKQIEGFMAQDHTFEEYCNVCELVLIYYACALKVP